MEPIDEEAYLTERLDDQLNWYDRKSGINQTWYKRLQLVQILCSTLIVFFSGAASELAYSHWLLAICSMLMAVATAVQSLNKYHDNWIEYRTTSETLKHEKYMYMARVEPYHQDNRFALLVTRIESVISSQNSNWSNVQQAAKKEQEEVRVGNG